MNPTLDQFSGCLLGLATGDALGAPYEGGLLERLVWRLIGRTSDGYLRWTDDTQMALDIAESLLEQEGLNPDALAQRFAMSYRWSRGYGPGAARVLKRIRRGETWEAASKAVYAEGSFGNGAAMRAPVLALFFAGEREGLVAAARTSAMLTHAHPLGIEGAVVIALATHALLERRTTSEVLALVCSTCNQEEISGRLHMVGAWLGSNATPSPRDVAAQLGNGITAPTSCPTALYLAIRYREKPFEEMMQFAIKCSGDVDTIGAMAGALWGAVNGIQRVPHIDLEARDQLDAVALRLFRRYASIAAAGQSAASDSAQGHR